MKATLSTHVNQTIVTLEGRLDTTNVSDFEQQIAELYHLAQPDIVFECTDFTYISSSGLRSLLTLCKHVNNKHGKLVLSNLPPNIKEVFDMTGFSTMFCIK